MKFADSGYHDGWEVTCTTKAYVYFYKPEYDGAERVARRYRWREWWERIANGDIEIETSPMKQLEIIAIAKQRVREMTASPQASAAVDPHVDSNTGKPSTRDKEGTN